MKITPQAYFIGGVAGVGKSSLIVHLKKLLYAEDFDIRDFDERGIPDGGGLDWHNAETMYWLDVAAKNAKQGKSTVICGFISPDRLRGMHKKDQHPPTKLFLLHASEDVIRKRLLGRYTTPESIKEAKRMTGLSLEEWMPDVVGYVSKMRELFEKDGSVIIDTDTKTPEEVAKEISVQILSDFNSSSKTASPHRYK